MRGRRGRGGKRRRLTAGCRVRAAVLEEEVEEATARSIRRRQRASWRRRGATGWRAASASAGSGRGCHPMQTRERRGCEVRRGVEEDGDDGERRRRDIGAWGSAGEGGRRKAGQCGGSGDGRPSDGGTASVGVRATGHCGGEWGIGPDPDRIGRGGVGASG